ncbi:male-specific histamine-binding salivary protein [Rhipicephalus microplus]|uniref:male-specific histamine-binding salivary protein n=1 Tax=Rhipicephalus microplus TaxID=6941 RepID=UPI0023766966
MNVYLLFSIFGLAVCRDSKLYLKPAWADEQKFHRYQDVKKSIQLGVNATFYLAKVTYNSESIWARNISCVRSTARTISDGVFNLTTIAKYTNQSDMHTSYAKVTVTKVYGYKNTKNGFKYKPQDGSMQSKYALTFSNYRTCSIYYGPTHVFSGDYELWVRDYKNIPPCCEFLFKYLTLAKRTRVMYKDICDSETDVKV